MHPRFTPILVALLAATPAFAVAGTPLDAFVPRCAPLGASQDDAASGADSKPEAPVLVAPGAHRACMDGTDRADGFRFRVEAGERIRVTLTPDRCSAMGLSLGEQGAGFDVDSAPRGGCGPRVVGWTAERTAEWSASAFLDAPDDSAEAQPYSLLVEVGAGLQGACGATQDDAGSGRDATREDPVPATTGAGCVDLFDRRDDYSMILAQGDAVLASLDAALDDCASGYLAVFSPGGSNVGINFLSWGDACERLDVGVVAPQSGEYRLRFVTAGGSGHYALAVTPNPPRACEGTSDFGASGDATRVEPVAAPLGASKGCVDAFDVDDWLRVEAPIGKRFVLTVSPGAACGVGVVVTRYDADRATGTVASGKACQSVDVPIQGSPGNEHAFVLVRHARGAGWYDVALRECAAPVGGSALPC